MKRNIPRAVFALLIPAFAGACAFLQRQSLAEPEVTVTDVRLTGAGTQGAKIDILLNIYNPNNFRIDASALHYRALVDSILVGEGEVPNRITLEKRDSGEVRVPVSFGFREALTVIQRFTLRGSLPFQIEGDIRFETPFGSTTRKFVQKGTYDGVNISILPRRKH
ncbi:MAG TPA: LEA type 2 family protein [Gemmatimonadaceae bacterium]|nr:LEA type 2 family protein [Gemmatimonadaceae bacterium]